MALYDITQLGSAVEFDITDYKGGSLGRLSTTTLVFAWQQTGASGVKGRTFNFNRSTGAITVRGDQVDLYPNQIAGNIVIRFVDSTHFVAGWVDFSGNISMCMYAVDASTGAISAVGSVRTISTSGQTLYSVELLVLTSTRMLVGWSGVAGDGFTQVWGISTSTGVDASGQGSAYEFDTNRASRISFSQISSTKVLVAYAGNSDNGYARVLDINTTTWAVTIAESGGSPFLFSNVGSNMSVTSIIMDTSASPVIATVAHCVTNFSNSTKWYISRLSINTTTWAITTLNSTTPEEISSEASYVNLNGTMNNLLWVDSTHFLIFFNGSGQDGFARSYLINLSTGALTQISEVEFDTGDGKFNTSLDMGDYLYLNAWQGASADGFIQGFTLANQVTFNPVMMHHMQIVGGLM